MQLRFSSSLTAALGCAAGLLLATAKEPARGGQVATGRNAVAATVHPLATEAALRVLREGGNAVDAVVAAGLTLGVVDGYNSGIGGGCFLLIRTADGRIHAIDGRETAPAAATRDLFVRGGQPVAGLSTTGALACAVPGALAAYDLALRDLGTRRLAPLLEEAAAIAEEGFLVDERYAARIAASAEDLRRFPGSRAVFLRADGSPRQAGERLVQEDLAATYRHIAAEGAGWFYGGPFAALVEAWMREQGGLVTAADLRGYRALRREPLRTRYRSFTVVGFPPPSSGGVHVAQILNILEAFDLGREAGAPDFAARTEGDRWHLVAEAMKRAFADRAHWLGDPAFAPVPRGLIDPVYARALAATIDPGRALPVPGHGLPPRFAGDLFSKHTTHFCAADAAGNWAACTATINTSFGCKVIVPGTGVVLNNEMDDFSIQPGVPNFFGLVGAEANAVAPGKRPLSSMSPTLVLRDGEPVFSVGAAGGPAIISQVVASLVRRLDLRLDAAACLAAPRLHHQWSPDVLRMENAWPEAVLQDLTARGHAVEREESLAVGQAIGRRPDGLLEAAADPRAGGAAGGF